MIQNRIWNIDARALKVACSYTRIWEISKAVMQLAASPLPISLRDYRIALENAYYESVIYDIGCDGGRNA